MKIEKLSDKQIRCTLTRDDLIDRRIKLSELAYGTEKAKALFRELIQQANFEFGFEAEDIPLMVEAIPLSSESLILIVTKVDDPDELDTRFSRFTGYDGDDDFDDDDFDDEDGDDEVMDLFRRFKGNDAQDAAKQRLDSDADNDFRTFVFEMPTLQQVMEIAKVVSSYYKGESVLYKDNRYDVYILALSQNGTDRNAFERVCNTVSEYGKIRRTEEATLSYMNEHFDVLVSKDALKKLAV
ncbi:MAG: adaptor protein MecA [Lachnospiraceae bacterium]|nr:adaptor protein MecA [Lachnospiraceae bacterium]